MVLLTQLLLLGFTYLFAVWVLDILDFDYSRGNQWVIALLVAVVLLYWRLGKYLVPDTGEYIVGGVLLLGAASMYKSVCESSA